MYSILQAAMKSEVTLLRDACCWHGFKEELCKAIKLQDALAVAGSVGVESKEKTL